MKGLLPRRKFLKDTAAAGGIISLGLTTGCNNDVREDTASEQHAAHKYHPLDGVQPESITITDVQVSLLSYELPKDKQWVSATFLVPKTDCCLVRVFTDQGVVGIGESSPYGGMLDMKQYIEEVIKPNIIGLNPFDISLIGAGGNTFMQACAWAGIDVACWDIIGKVKGQPVYRFLSTQGEPETHIKMYASSGVEYAWYDRPEDLIDKALEHKEAGYTAMKYRIGTDWEAGNITVKDFIPLIQQLREAVGDDFDLMQENNMRLNLAQCLELAPVLEELNILWWEEPVNRRAEGALEEHIRLSEELDSVLISGGETMENRFIFKEWIDREAYGIVQPDCNTTGLTEGWHIAQLAHLKGIPCCPHNWHGGLTTMSNAHLVAGIPNRLMLELNQTYNPFKKEIFKDPLVVIDGYMDLPDKPGYGVELIDNVEEKYPYIEGSWAITNPLL